jgi:hypothetical protein
MVAPLQYARAADRRIEAREAASSEQAMATGAGVALIGRALGISTAPSAQTGDDTSSLATEERRWALAVTDINNDGRDELLIASPWGPHSSMLHVYGQSDDFPESFGKLAEISSGTPAGFTVGDLDGDGRTEVATIQPVEPHPYATGIREEVLYRWDGRAFAVAGDYALARPGEPGFDDPHRPPVWHSGTELLTVLG